MTTNCWGRIAVALWGGVVLLGFPGAAVAADSQAAPEPMGNDTYSLTRTAGFAFLRNTAKLEKEARMDAIEFCASLGRKMKEVSMTSKKASPILGGISHATIIFTALDPADPEVASLPLPAARTPVAAPRAPALAPREPAHPTGVGDLDKLVGLHDRKLLSDAEFEDAKNRVKEGSNDLDLLVELQRKGVLTDAEFEAAQRRLAARPL
jgi:hypothetical protein